MSTVEVKDKLDNIEKVIFENSFQKNMPLEKLGLIYFNLIEIRNQFLRTNFIEFQQPELEEIRYRINENILNIRIWIRKNKGLSIDLEVRQMEELFNLYQLKEELF